MILVKRQNMVLACLTIRNLHTKSARGTHLDIR